MSFAHFLGFAEVARPSTDRELLGSLLAEGNPRENLFVLNFDGL